MGDLVQGGAGNDKIYGQGFASHMLYGNAGDDYVVGGKGDDQMFGDGYGYGTEDDGPLGLASDTFAPLDFGT